MGDTLKWEWEIDCAASSPLSTFSSGSSPDPTRLKAVTAWPRWAKTAATDCPRAGAGGMCQESAGNRGWRGQIPEDTGNRARHRDQVEGTGEQVVGEAGTRGQAARGQAQGGARGREAGGRW